MASKQVSKDPDESALVARTDLPNRVANVPTVVVSQSATSGAGGGLIAASLL